MNFIICACIAYIFGSIPTGIWIGKLVFKKDIRQYGSGNMGTTNTFRVFGPTAGTVVFLIDLLKGYIPVYLAMYVLPVNPLSPLLVGLFALVGHTFPLFANFKGGKAVATLGGVIFAYNPLLFIISMTFFTIFLFTTRMVSLTSMLTIACGIIATLFFQDWLLTVVAIAIEIFIVIRHKDNIKRIKEGTESKITFPWEKEKTDDKPNGQA